MKILERLYRSCFGRPISSLARFIYFFQRPRMIYGYTNPVSGQFHKFTRISSTVAIMSPNKLNISDHVWVWHHSIIDATEGIKIGEGCQIGAWVGIFTHGSENSIRLLGNKFVHIPNQLRQGYTRGHVKIGPYTFIGASSIIFPGVKIGKGCLIGAGSFVLKDVPDYSVVLGRPAQVVGNTIDMDAKHFVANDFSGSYYDRSALDEIEKRLTTSTI